LRGDGVRTVSFYSTDVAGNTETTGATSFKIDTTAPSTTAALSGTLQSGWYRSTVTVTLSGSDASSGVAGTFYEVDGGTFQSYSGSFAVSGDGSHTVSFYSTDVAGNTETTGA